MKGIFTEVIMTLLALSFMAWAGVVWNASEKLQETLTQFVIASEHRFTVLEKDVDDLKYHLSRHRDNNIIIKKAP